MRSNCAALVADLFLFCYEKDFMKSLSRVNQTDIIEAFNSTSRHHDDLLNIDNIHFEQMVDRMVSSHFVPRSFPIRVISHLLWSFRTHVLVVSYPVTTISYPGHFVPSLVISYLGQMGTK